MRALCWHGKGDGRVDTVPDPQLQHPRDAIIKITCCAICGSDLHLLDGYQPTMESGDILGHENMGEVVELGAEVTNLRIGNRVVAPFTISCGDLSFGKLPISWLWLRLARKRLPSAGPTKNQQPKGATNDERGSPD
ncbi:hypothetical protein B5U99_00630 [Bosea sp. Tri-54]|nr:hypothetical protein BLM15_30050 [Bosea sp. Tri-49]RXT42443.1 hypothetical protein B5U99_00630 [Bosea sp. Tri-54]